MAGKESDDTREQARQAFEKLKILLSAAGATLQHVVKVTLYLHGLKSRLPFHDVWMECFPKGPPARIAIQVAVARDFAQKSPNTIKAFLMAYLDGLRRSIDDEDYAQKIEAKKRIRRSQTQRF